MDPSKHYRYCSIQGLDDQDIFHRSSENTTKELILEQKWRPFDEKGTPNPYYSSNQSILQNYLQNYKTEGIDLLESTILGVLNNNDKIVDKFDSLPGLRKFFDKSGEKEMDLMKKFANVKYQKLMKQTKNGTPLNMKSFYSINFIFFCFLEELIGFSATTGSCCDQRLNYGRYKEELEKLDQAVNIRKQMLLEVLY
uniref:Mediator of RNA polymerase II transcription subunit 7 n=1 Tax=Caenorhabditis tropicalis TaxID=1561998 RepID=A0A1I7UJ74_9PELO